MSRLLISFLYLYCSVQILSSIVFVRAPMCEHVERQRSVFLCLQLLCPHPLTLELTLQLDLCLTPPPGGMPPLRLTFMGAITPILCK